MKDPIVILGSPRSGTTILGQLLSVHPSLHYEEEPRLTWRYGNDDKSDLLRPSDLDQRKIEYIRKAFSQRVVKSGKERLLEKTPSNSMRPDFVKAVYPNAKWIYIYRNPVDCILSIRDLWQRKSHGLRVINRANYMRRLKELRMRHLRYYSGELLQRCVPKKKGQEVSNLWGPRFPGMKAMLREQGLLAVCCMQWRLCTENCEDFIRKYPDDVYSVEIGQLNLRNILEIFAHCEIEPSKEVEVAFRENFDRSITGKRDRVVSSEDLEVIRLWLGPHFNEV